MADPARRKRLRWTLFAVVPLAVLAAVAWWYVYGDRYESTDNAYVKVDMVNLSSEIAGRIVEVMVADNQPVYAGDVLVRIDAQPYEVSLHRAEADLQKARMEVARLKATLAQNQAALAAARDDLAFATKRQERAGSLRARDVVSQSALDEAQRDLDVARNTVARLESESAATLVELSGNPTLPPDQHPSVLAAQSALTRARLDLGRCELRAPIDGIAVNTPTTGAYAMVGMSVLSVVSGKGAWVEANFKEDQLGHMQPGDPVEVVLDAYPDETWQARVQSIGPATGAEFALLPPQNATGNWVKVVQRLPVRIALEHRDGESALRAGLSATVKVDTGIQPRMQPVYAWLGREAKDGHERGPVRQAALDVDPT